MTFLSNLGEQLAPPQTEEEVIPFCNALLQGLLDWQERMEDSLGSETNTEPVKRENLMLRYADGTDWNPGSGPGFYYWNGSLWIALSGGVTDHGGLSGLGDNDHTQYPLKTLWDANTILKADADDTPIALTVAEQRIVGRITGGNIKALTVGELITLINTGSGLEYLPLAGGTVTGNISIGGNLEIENTNPTLWMIDTNSPLDSGDWLINTLPSTLTFRAYNEAHDAFSAWLNVIRSTFNIASVNFPEGAVTIAETLGVTGAITENGNQVINEGTANWVDLTDGGATTLHSHAGGGGDVVLIASGTASDDALLTLTGMDGTYKMYLFVGVVIVPATDGALGFLRVTQSGVVQASGGDYAWTGFTHGGGGSGPSVSNSDSEIHITGNNTMGNEGGESGSFYALIPNPANGARRKNIFGMSGFNTMSGIPINATFTGSLIADNNAIDGVSYSQSSGNITSGEFALFGLKFS